MVQAKAELTRRLVGAGDVARHCAGGGRPVDAARTSRAAQLYDAGWSLDEIGAELGLSRSAVYQRLRLLERRQGGSL